MRLVSEVMMGMANSLSAVVKMPDARHPLVGKLKLPSIRTLLRPEILWTR